MNSLELIGNLTADPVMKTVMVKNVPTEVTNFSIAVNERGKDKDEPIYFRCHAWRGLAETCHKYLKKGRKVFVKGPVRINSYKDNNNTIRYAMEVRVEDVEFLDKRPADETPDGLEQLDESELIFT